MVEYNKVNVKSSDSQLNEFESAAKTKQESKFLMKIIYLMN